MTIATDTRAGSYVSDGSLNPRVIGFPFASPADIRITVNDAPRLLNVHYLVTGIFPGGRIVPLAGYAAAGQTVRYWRETPARQDYDISGSEIRAAALEATLDRQAMAVQDLGGSLGRAVLVPQGEAPIVLPRVAARQNRFATYDGAGNPAAARSLAEFDALGAAVVELQNRPPLPGTPGGNEMAAGPFSGLRLGQTVIKLATLRVRTSYHTYIGQGPAWYVRNDELVTLQYRADNPFTTFRLPDEFGTMHGYELERGVRHPIECFGVYLSIGPPPPGVQDANRIAIPHAQAFGAISSNMRRWVAIGTGPLGVPYCWDEVGYGPDAEYLFNTDDSVTWPAFSISQCYLGRDNKLHNLDGTISPPQPNVTFRRLYRKNVGINVGYGKYATCEYFSNLDTGTLDDCSWSSSFRGFIAPSGTFNLSINSPQMHGSFFVNRSQAEIDADWQDAIGICVGNHAKIDNPNGGGWGTGLYMGGGSEVNGGRIEVCHCSARFDNFQYGTPDYWDGTQFYQGTGAFSGTCKALSTESSRIGSWLKAVNSAKFQSIGASAFIGAIQGPYGAPTGVPLAGILIDRTVGGDTVIDGMGASVPDATAGAIYNRGSPTIVHASSTVMIGWTSLFSGDRCAPNITGGIVPGSTEPPYGDRTKFVVTHDRQTMLAGFTAPRMFGTVAISPIMGVSFTLPANTTGPFFIPFRPGFNEAQTGQSFAVTLETTPGATLAPRAYAYALTFVRENGQETGVDWDLDAPFVGSNAYKAVTVTAYGQRVRIGWAYPSRWDRQRVYRFDLTNKHVDGYWELDPNQSVFVDDGNFQFRGRDIPPGTAGRILSEYQPDGEYVVQFQLQNGLIVQSINRQVDGIFLTVVAPVSQSTECSVTIYRGLPHVI